MEVVMEAVMVAKQRDWRSLSDLGFTSVGLDDAWQGFDSGKPGIDACSPAGIQRHFSRRARQPSVGQSNVPRPSQNGGQGPLPGPQGWMVYEQLP